MAAAVVRCYREPEFAEKIGADAYAEDAAVAVDIVRGFFKEEN